MTSDTIKSLGYLKKSLKMSKRAIEKNKASDQAGDFRFDEMNKAIDTLNDFIDEWMNISVPSIPPTPPVTILTPVASVSNIPIVDDGDLLTT